MKKRKGAGDGRGGRMMKILEGGGWGGDKVRGRVMGV